jgi:hypothetical protein
LGKAHIGNRQQPANPQRNNGKEAAEQRGNPRRILPQWGW